jgi:predicted RNA-binding Zn-ribbon protein involved in translation (DUF1610 family)
MMDNRTLKQENICTSKDKRRRSSEHNMAQYSTIKMCPNCGKEITKTEKEGAGNRYVSE